MLTENEIAEIETFDVKALEEGLRQVELSLSDSLSTKESLTKKTLSLLAIFISFSTITIGLSTSNFFYLKNHSLNIVFYCSGFFFLLATIFLLVSMLYSKYGALGRFPDTFLKKEYLSGEHSSYGYTLAIILRQYAERIKVSEETNNKRAWWIGSAVIIAMLAPFFSGFYMLIHYLF